MRVHLLVRRVAGAIFSVGLVLGSDGGATRAATKVCWQLCTFAFNFSPKAVASLKILALTRVFGRFDIVYRGRAGDIVYRGQSKVIKK